MVAVAAAAKAAETSTMWGEAETRTAHPGGGARLRVQYDTHLPALSLQYRDKFRTLLVGVVLRTFHGHFFVRTSISMICVGINASVKNSHVPTNPDVVATITGMMKTAWGG